MSIFEKKKNSADVRHFWTVFVYFFLDLETSDSKDHLADF